MVTIPGNIKISDVRVTLDNEAKVSCIILETAIRLGLLIIKNQSIALKTITRIKSRFISYANNIITERWTSDMIFNFVCELFESLILV